MEFYMKNLQQAEEKIKKIENLIVLAQVSKNKRLTLITLEEIERAIKHCISSMLHYDYLMKKVKVTKDPIKNLKVFEKKSSKNYFINQNEIKIIKEILNLTKTHKQSPMEFVKNSEIIIISEDQKISKLSMQKLTNFLSLTKKITKQIKNRVHG